MSPAAALASIEARLVGLAAADHSKILSPPSLWSPSNGSTVWARVPSEYKPAERASGAIGIGGSAPPHLSRRAKEPGAWPDRASSREITLRSSDETYDKLDRYNTPKTRLDCHELL